MNKPINNKTFVNKTIVYKELYCKCCNSNERKHIEHILNTYFYQHKQIKINNKDDLIMTFDEWDEMTNYD